VMSHSEFSVLFAQSSFMIYLNVCFLDAYLYACFGSCSGCFVIQLFSFVS